MALFGIAFELILSTAFLSIGVGGAPLQNDTVLVPPGTTNHGNPKLLCTPTTWYKTLVFLVTNYFAHAATVNQFPGEKLYPYLFAISMSLMYPYVGIIRGLEPIFRHARFEKHPLKMATQAGALCIIVRDDGWTPAAGEQLILDVLVGYTPDKKRSGRGDAGAEELHMLAHAADCDGYSNRAAITVDYINFTARGLEQPVPSIDAKVHGIRLVPPGYALRVLPSNAVVVPNADLDPNEIEVTSSSNLSKTLVALIQLISGATTLFRTRGDETTRYGYAAFGLTVIPYMVMSLINLTGSFLTPHYESLYLVHSPELEEARSRGGVFDGTIGKILPSDRVPGLGSTKVAIFESDVTGTMATVTTTTSTDYPSHAQTTPKLDSRVSRQSQKLAHPSQSDVSSGHHGRVVSFEIVPRQTDHAAKIIVPRCTPYQQSGPSRWGHGKNLFLIGCLFQAIPYLVIAGLTRFHAGESTRAQRIWTMLWLTFGVVFGWAMTAFDHLEHNYVGVYCVLLLLAAPAVGGYVAVCRMLKAYGYCVEIGGDF